MAQGPRSWAGDGARGQVVTPGLFPPPVPTQSCRCVFCIYSFCSIPGVLRCLSPEQRSSPCLAVAPRHPRGCWRETEAPRGPDPTGIRRALLLGLGTFSKVVRTRRGCRAERVPLQRAAPNCPEPAGAAAPLHPACRQPSEHPLRQHPWDSPSPGGPIQPVWALVLGARPSLLVLPRGEGSQGQDRHPRQVSGLVPGGTPLIPTFTPVRPGAAVRVASTSCSGCVAVRHRPQGGFQLQLGSGKHLGT